MLELDFAGWFQCRLATDPDPADECRGVSGWSFALGHERDLDRVIRFHDPVDLRSHAPLVGVRVGAVRVDHQNRPEHPLYDARFDLLGEPRFEGRNGLVTEDGHEPIHPFKLEVSRESVSLRREDPLDPEDSPIHEVTVDELERRCGGGLDLSPAAAADVAEATGVPDADLWIRQRDDLLKKEIAGTTDKDQKAVLTTRLWALRNRATHRKQLVAQGGRVSYKFAVGEHGSVGAITRDRRDFGGDPDVERPWPIKFWLGGWQADVLCGYVKGTLGVPFQLPPRP